MKPRILFKNTIRKYEKMGYIFEDAFRDLKDRFKDEDSLFPYNTKN